MMANFRQWRASAQLGGAESATGFLDARQAVAENVHRLRLERGLSADALAKCGGVSREYIVALERAHRNPTVLLLSELARALCVTPVDLLQSPTAPARSTAHARSEQSD